jgi:hypothetical protein
MIKNTLDGQSDPLAVMTRLYSPLPTPPALNLEYEKYSSSYKAHPNRDLLSFSGVGQKIIQNRTHHEYRHMYYTLLSGFF